MSGVPGRGHGNTGGGPGIGYQLAPGVVPVVPIRRQATYRGRDGRERFWYVIGMYFLVATTVERSAGSMSRPRTRERLLGRGAASDRAGRGSASGSMPPTSGLQPDTAQPDRPMGGGFSTGARLEVFVSDRRERTSAQTALRAARRTPETAPAAASAVSEARSRSPSSIRSASPGLT